MSRVAVTGGGISALGAAWLLARQHDVALFEREARLDGHTRTHRLDTPDGPLAVDTGFIVRNDRTYPLLVRLPDQPAAMAGAAHEPVRGRREGSARESA